GTGCLCFTLNDGTAALDNQTFFGPGLQIAGKVSVDKTFAVINGANSTVYTPLRLPSGNFVLSGAFDDYETTKVANLGLGGIVQVNTLGAVDKSLKFGVGANGAITSMTRITSGSQTGKFLIGGTFSSFNSRRSNRQNINFLTRLNVDGTLDSTFVDVINLRPNDPTKNKDTVPSFNGGVGLFGNGFGGVFTLVKRVFSLGDKVYVVGNFDRYLKAFYERSTFDTKVYDNTTIRQVVRMSADGSMDSTYRFDVSTKTSPASGNGVVNDAVQLADGSLILVGSFTTFDGSTKNRIVKLKPDGTVDQTFATGTGANGDILSIGYNATTNKIVVAGVFTTFNGQPLAGVALLNVDGSLSSGFTFPSLSGGFPSFARQMNSGKIIVSGAFNRYNGVLRQGFMVLNPNGSLANGYNNTGVFIGQILDMIEVTSSDGNPAAILVGDIIRFNNSAAHNVIKVEFQN
ncbi:delta-60 repeat domain-containing protein, partial [Pedobacter sp. ASV28]|uniref:delta-60 repeat domain-containing protein n=1 Tax=Pedobacter sp. ASV28 TaxID=2795123 RepID=UPI0018EB3C01